MKNLLLIGAIISFFTCQMQAQQKKYPQGAYMSFEEIVNKTPSMQLYENPSILDL